MGKRIDAIKEILKKDKKILLLLILAIIGIVVLMFSELFTVEKDNEEKITSITTNEYAETIEKKLSELVSSIDGAGETVVMVTIETGKENVFAKEIKSEEDENKQSSSYEYEYVVIKSGSSVENGMLLKVIEPEIRGVAIVCDGGENPTVRENIINTVSAVLDIKTNSISVCKKNAW